MTAALFFPMQAPFDQGYLAVGQGHRIWYAQYGNPAGIPLLWLHGGPGSGSSVRHQLFADPAHYRLILADQRGCGQSTPSGCTDDNDTDRLLKDIADLRTHLSLGNILLGGGSWGACLALAYAQRWPANLLGLVLRAPFLPSDIRRFFQPVSMDLAWQRFASVAPAGAEAQLLAYIAQQFATDGAEVATIAQAWSRYEDSRSSPQIQPDATPVELERLIRRYRIQAHYLSHQCFLESASFLETGLTLAEVPVLILQGVDDRICSPDNAVLLQATIPGSLLQLVAGAGHNPFHPALAVALLEALNGFSRTGNFNQN